MTKLAPMAMELDIWGIIWECMNFSEDWAIEESTLNLVTGEGSYVEVRYYKLDDVLSQAESLQEVPSVERFELSLDDARKMYSSICDMVQMPEMVDSLHVHLTAGNIVHFDVKFVPVLKKGA